MQKKILMYQHNQLLADVQELSPKDLLLKLYDGLILNLKRAIFYIEQQNIEEKINYINKSLNIIQTGFIDCLNKDINKEVSNSLNQFYETCMLDINKANLDNDTEILNKTIKNIEHVKEAWIKV